MYDKPNKDCGAETVVSVAFTAEEQDSKQLWSKSGGKKASELPNEQGFFALGDWQV